MPAPTRVPSFGPNGTHWPSAIPTPWWTGDDAGLTIDVPCSAPPISATIGSLTSAEVAAGVIIRVAPGTITGAGVGSGDTPVLQSIGDPTWTKRVLVRPLNGYATLDINAARFFKVHNVAFAGIRSTGVKFHGCRRAAWTWTRMTGKTFVYGHPDVPAVDDFELVETVYEGLDLRGGDDWIDFYTHGSNIVRPKVDGCYVQPRYRAVGSSTHNDGIQFEPVDPDGAGPGASGSTSDALVRDSALFAGSNCALMPKGNGCVIEHTAVMGRQYTIARYPIPSGYESTGHSLNGGTVDNLKIRGGTIIAKDSGSSGITSSPNPGNTMIAEVTSGFVPVTQTGNAAHAGWTVEANCGNRALAESPVPTTEKLQSFWTESAPMPGQLTTVGANIALDAASGRATATARTMYIALLTAAPTDATTMATMTEYSAAGYSRQSAAFAAPSGDPSATTNTGAVTFGPLTGANGAVTITHAALVSASTGTAGDMVYYWQLDSSRTPLANDTLQFAVSALSATLD